MKRTVLVTLAFTAFGLTPRLNPQPQPRIPSGGQQQVCFVFNNVNNVRHLTNGCPQARTGLLVEQNTHTLQQTRTMITLAGGKEYGKTWWIGDWNVYMETDNPA